MARTTKLVSVDADPIVSLQQIKDHLRILHNTDDSYLTALIFVAESTVENDTDRILAKKTFIDFLADDDRLCKQPVTTIVAMWDDILGDVLTGMVEEVPWVLEAGQDAVSLAPPANSLKITYTCETVRATDLAIAAQAILMLVTDMYLERSTTVSTSTKENPTYLRLINCIRNVVI